MEDEMEESYDRKFAAVGAYEDNQTFVKEMLPGNLNG